MDLHLEFGVKGENKHSYIHSNFILEKISPCFMPDEHFQLSLKRTVDQT